jgi:hypothetical protein
MIVNYRQQPPKFIPALANQTIKGRRCTKELNMFLHAFKLPIAFNFATMKQSH